MSIADVMSRISEIQTQIAALNTGVIPPTQGTAATGAVDPTSTTTAPATAPTSFAGALAQAQAPTVSGHGLTSGQARFASRLAAQTGLSPQVIGAWLLAEESGGAAQSREQAGNNDWLNIGYTDSGTFGAADSIWSTPESAADATAGWLKGQNTVPGYGPASAGIRAILATAGQSPDAQVQAIQRSGWASSGYPDLPGLLTQVSN